MRYLIWLAALLPLLASTAELPPVREFFAVPKYSHPAISPDGGQCAILSSQDGRLVVNVVELGTLQSKPVAQFDRDGLLDYWWVGRDRFLFLTTDHQLETSFKLLDLNAGAFVPLPVAMEPNLTRVRGVLEDGTLVVANFARTSGVEVQRINFATRKTTVTEPARQHIYRWLLNARGETVAGLGRKDGVHWFCWWRDRPDGDLKRYEIGHGQTPPFWVVGVHPDQRRLLAVEVTAEPNQKVFAWNPATDEREELPRPLSLDPARTISWPGEFDVVRGVSYEMETTQQRFLRPEDAELLAKVDATVKGRVNQIVSRSTDGAVQAILSSNHQTPGNFLILDTRRGSLKGIAAVNAALLPEQLGVKKSFTFTATDGLALSGQMIAPRNVVRPPLIVMVGPELLDSTVEDQFDPSAQVLASRGYAVARIYYRGVRGLGRAHERAGDAQLHGRMPQDLADGVGWLAKAGWIDPARVGIFGDEVGGILAMLAAGRSAAFSVWINRNTPMDKNELPLAELAGSARSDDEYREVFSNYFRARSYRDRISPRKILPTRAIPSFHFYDIGGDNRVRHDGGWLEGKLKAGTAPYVFLRAKDYLTFRDSYRNVYERMREEQIRFHEELLKFLAAQWGGAAGRSDTP